MAYNQHSTCLRDTDDLEDSYLNLRDIIENGDEITYVLRWVVRNYGCLEFRIQYSAHYIRIGKILHRLRIMKYDTNFQHLPTNKNLIYLYLGLTPNPDFARVSIAILKRDEEMPPLSCMNIYFQGLMNRKCLSGFIEPKEFQLNSQNPTILCRITVQKGVEVSIEKSNLIPSVMGDLFQTGMLSDLTINVGGRKFLTHCAILAVRSLVFKTMFQNEMKEKTERTLDILDSDPDIFRNFLWYLYTGKTNPLCVEIALPLLRLADKYDVKELKSELEEFLLSNLSINSVLEVLLAVDMCNVLNLKEEVIRFIAYNLGEVMKNDEWKQFRNHSDLVDEILSYIYSEFLEY